MNYPLVVLIVTSLFYLSAAQYDDCGNGVCDKDENCLTCPSDCISGTSGGFDCGNGVCEDGETCYTCPDDCNGETVEEGTDLYCCYGGPTDPGVPHSTSCEDIRCGKMVGKCSVDASPLVSYCCGDGTCDGEETEMNCPSDGCVEICGNGVCDIAKGESAENCALDCKCNLNGICEEGETLSACPLDCTCGNYVCDVDQGETVANCDHDCSCNADYMCQVWEDAVNCPMENCPSEGKDTGKMSEDDDYEDLGDDDYDLGKCSSNGVSCGEHSECCSYACDEVCVG